MRKLIIDTDCGSDDAVALIMALKSREVSVEAITTVGGNVPMELATQNALMTMEITGAQMPPLYAGAAKPLFRELVTAVNVCLLYTSLRQMYRLPHRHQAYAGDSGKDYQGHGSDGRSG